MKTHNAPDFENALLELDTALRPLVYVQRASERAVAVRTAYKRFLAAAMALRLKAALSEEALPATPAAALALFERVLKIELAAGVSRQELAATFTSTIGAMAGDA